MSCESHIRHGSTTNGWTNHAWQWAATPAEFGVKKNLNLLEKEFHLWILKHQAMPGMSQFAALVVELAAKLGAAVPSAKVGTSMPQSWKFQRRIEHQEKDLGIYI